MESSASIDLRAANSQIQVSCATLAGQPLDVSFVKRCVHRARRLLDRKSTRLNSSHRCISYAVFCLKKIQSCLEAARVHSHGSASSFDRARLQSCSSFHVDFLLYFEVRDCYESPTLPRVPQRVQ